MIDSRCTLLAMEAGRTLFVDQEEVVRMADEHHICICAVDTSF